MKTHEVWKLKCMTMKELVAIDKCYFLCKCRMFVHTHAYTHITNLAYTYTSKDNNDFKVKKKHSDQSLLNKYGMYTPIV